MIDDFGENEHTGTLAVHIVLAMLVVVWSGLCGGLFYIINNLRF